MGRRKTYVREAVLVRAMELFWERGFHRTSTRELASAMGINVYSLYAEFGSKEGLFAAATEHYEREIVPSFIGALEREDASLDTVLSILRFFAGRARGEGTHRGCLLCNAAVELAPDLDASRASTEAYVERLTGAFQGALERAQADGSLRADADALGLARFLSTMMIGIFVLLRAQVEGAVLRAAVEHALARLEALRAA
ncbi:MAG: TetR family transcriptional regulator [Sandaracinaceae bacterium]